MDASRKEGRPEVTPRGASHTHRAPALSVIIPLHGRAEMGLRAARSVLAQSMSDLELILVDDGTPDAADAVLAGIDDTRVRLEQHPFARGAAAARNTGVAAAASSLVAFLDSDDIWAPGMAAAQLQTLAPFSGRFTGATTGFVLSGPNGFTQHRLAAPPKELLTAAARGCTLAPGSTLAISRSMWLAVGGEEESLERLEDWDLLLRLARHGARLAFIPRPLARIEHSLPGPRPEVVRRSCERLLAEHLPWIQDQSPRLARQLSGRAAYEVGLALLRHRELRRAVTPILQAMLTDPRAHMKALKSAASRRIPRTRAVLGEAIARRRCDNRAATGPVAER